MLDGEGDPLVLAPPVKVGVAPGVELRGAPWCLAGAGLAAVLLGVMDEQDGKVVVPLKPSQVGEEYRARA